MDYMFAFSLKSHDVKKTKKRAWQKSVKGKLKRRDGEFAKYAEGHKEQMDDLQTGKTYGAGIALSNDRKSSRISIKVLYHVHHIMYPCVTVYPFLQYGEWQKILKYFHKGTVSCTLYYLSKCDSILNHIWIEYKIRSVLSIYLIMCYVLLLIYGLPQE